MRANWKRRYFALWNSKLFYYFLTEKLCNEFLSGSSSNNQSRGFIDLTTVTKLSVEKRTTAMVIKLATKERLWCISPTNDDFSKIWHILKLAKNLPDDDLKPDSSRSKIPRIKMMNKYRRITYASIYLAKQPVP